MEGGAGGREPRSNGRGWEVYGRREKREQEAGYLRGEQGEMGGNFPTFQKTLQQKMHTEARTISEGGGNRENKG